jgi:hypothetical protein
MSAAEEFARADYAYVLQTGRIALEGREADLSRLRPGCHDSGPQHVDPPNARARRSRSAAYCSGDLALAFQQRIYSRRQRR